MKGISTASFELRHTTLTDIRQRFPAICHQLCARLLSGEGLVAIPQSSHSAWGSKWQ